MALLTSRYRSATGAATLVAFILVLVFGSPWYGSWVNINTRSDTAGGLFLRTLAWPAWSFDSKAQVRDVLAADLKALLLILFTALFVALLVGPYCPPPGVRWPRSSPDGARTSSPRPSPDSLPRPCPSTRACSARSAGRSAVRPMGFSPAGSSVSRRWQAAGRDGNVHCGLALGRAALPGAGSSDRGGLAAQRRVDVGGGEVPEIPPVFDDPDPRCLAFEYGRERLA